MTKFVIDNGKNLFESYDKPEIDAIAATKAENFLIGNAAGNIATFETMFADDLTAINAEINAVQSGSGDPSPDNVRPISGFSALNITRCGKNLFSYDDLTLYAGYFDGAQFNGTPLDVVNIETVESWRWCYYLISVSGKTSITLSGFDTNGGTMAVWLSDLNDFSNFQNAFSSNEKNGVHSIPNDAKYLLIPMNDARTQRTNYANAQAEFGTIATAFELYDGQTFFVSFGRTVYCGTFNESGKLTIKWGADDLGSLNWIYTSGDHSRFESTTTLDNAKIVAGNIIPNALCEIYKMESMNNIYLHSENEIIGYDSYVWVYDSNAGTDANAFKTSVTGKILAYELATPIEIDLTAAELSTIIGENNVFHNCNGQIAVSYKDTIQHYIDSRLNA